MRDSSLFPQKPNFSFPKIGRNWRKWNGVQCNFDQNLHNALYILQISYNTSLVICLILLLSYLCPLLCLSHIITSIINTSNTVKNNNNNNNNNKTK